MPNGTKPKMQEREMHFHQINETITEAGAQKKALGIINQWMSYDISSVKILRSETSRWLLMEQNDLQEVGSSVIWSRDCQEAGIKIMNSSLVWCMLTLKPKICAEIVGGWAAFS